MKSLMPQIDSNDGLFHNGNPATGEQGTRVTDTWLNNLQDRVRDVQEEAHYVLQKAGFRPVENKQTQLYEAIVKIIDDNRKTASLTQKGETQLYTGYDSQSEDLALTPKTAYQLKQFIDSNTRALGNVIQNSKKSSAVDSNSADTVATSAAVKTAYDKGVEAKTAADHAQLTANDGVAKANAVNVAFNVLRDLFIGVPIPYPLSTVPTGCLAMNGQRFDTRRYPKLAQKYPSGQLPDMRGEFIRGWDNGRGVDGNRALLSDQKPSIMAIDNNIANLAATGIVMLDDSTVQQAAQHASADLLNRNDYPNVGFVLNAFNDTDTRDKAIQDKYTAASGVSRILSTPSSARGWGAFGVRPRNIAYYYICLAE